MLCLKQTEVQLLIQRLHEVKDILVKLVNCPMLSFLEPLEGKVKVKAMFTLTDVNVRRMHFPSQLFPAL